MKVGDLVRLKERDGMTGWNESRSVGFVVEFIEKKCWRTSEQSKKVNWDKIDPEPHAVVLFGDSSGPMTIPQFDLEVVKINGYFFAKSGVDMWLILGS